MTMQAIFATPGGLAWTERREVEIPDRAPDEALVAVRAFALNRGELTLLRTRQAGWRPGQDVAGEVVRAAADGSGPAEGARVAGLADTQGWAEYAAVPTGRLAVLPDEVSEAQGATLGIAGTTAIAVVDLGGPLLGRRVLVTGATGGVGRFAVQLARIAGAEVSADGDEYDVVLESVGGATLGDALGKVAHGGTLVTFGNSAAEPAPLDFRAFAGREVAIRAYFSTHHAGAAGGRLARLVALIASDRLEAPIDREADWSELDATLDALAAREIHGKAVLHVR